MVAIVDYKNIQRICAVVIKAIERCFVRPEIIYIKSEYNRGRFVIEIDCILIGNESITLKAADKDATYCANLFLTSLEESVNNTIASLTETSDLERYDENYIINYSSVMMFKQIINSLQKPLKICS